MKPQNEGEPKSDHLNSPHRMGGSPESTSRLLILAAVLLSAALWGFAIRETYTQAPKTLRLWVEFDISGSRIALLVLRYAGKALPIFALAGLLVALKSRSRWAWSFVLVWLPLVVAATLWVLQLFAFNRTLEYVN